jgi:hypothetical protein
MAVHDDCNCPNQTHRTWIINNFRAALMGLKWSVANQQPDVGNQINFIWTRMALSAGINLFLLPTHSTSSDGEILWTTSWLSAGKIAVVLRLVKCATAAVSVGRPRTRPKRGRSGKWAASDGRLDAAEMGFVFRLPCVGPSRRGRVVCGFCCRDTDHFLRDGQPIKMKLGDAR